MNSENSGQSKRVKARWGRYFLISIFILVTRVAFAESGESVIVIYNSAMPESKEVADHYAQRRHVPAEQVVGFDLPTTETMSREEFRSDLQKPLFKYLQNKKLFTVRSASVTATNGIPSKVFWAVKESKIRYAVLCYGVPSRILEDDDISEPAAAAQMPEGLRRNRAAVDSELVGLPLIDLKLPVVGYTPNIFFKTTNAAAISPTEGILLVGRLDGPTPGVAKGLVDKAMEGEEKGLWGRAYFDLRGVTSGPYMDGEDSFQCGVNAVGNFGFQTIVDNQPETFPASFPMSQIALYCGWYDENVSGPFTLPKVEFMPGAFAYHLHSFSAATIRSADKHWVGPLLAKGAAATIGYVDEPYLGGTIDVGAFLERFLNGWSLGEAALAAQVGFSWQTVVLGDPLYRPFARTARQMHESLETSNDPLVQWSHLRLINLNAAHGFSADEIISYIEQVGKKSPILMEKLGDIYLKEGKTWPGINAYAQALNLNPSPQQEIRLMLTLAEKFETAGRPTEAIDTYKLLAKRAPGYPDLKSVYKKIAELEKKGPK